MTDLKAWVEKKLRNGKAGRPNLLTQFAKQGKDPYDELMNILRMAYIYNKKTGEIAKKYGVSRWTIKRLLSEIEQNFDMQKLQEMVKTYFETKRRIFYDPKTDYSDYETVRLYIKRAKREGLKLYKCTLKLAKKVWKALKYKDPAKWTADEVLEVLQKFPDSAQFNLLVACRQVAPQLKEGREAIPTSRFKEKQRRRIKYIFKNEVKMILEALRAYNLKFHELIFKLHVTVGAREGHRYRSGITGIKFSDFHNDFHTVDDYEGKVKGGITWKNCPVDLFFKDLPEQIKKLWEERGKPSDEYLLKRGYRELLNIYKEIRKAVAEYWKGKLPPDIYNEITTIRPHDADKIHVNMCWEAEIPLEIVAGQYLGHGEGIGLVGRGWLDLNTLKQHYLALTQRSERFKKLMAQVREYAKDLS